MLAGLYDELARRGATLRVAEAHAGVRDLLRACGLEEKSGVSTGSQPSPT